MLDPDRVETVTFDSYSTIVDVDSVERALADRVPEPEPVSRTWRYQSLSYAMASNFLDAYRPFYDHLRDALDYALAAHGVDLDRDGREAVLETYHDLRVFDDVRDGMERLASAGYDLYVVSNGNPGMLDSMVDSAGIGDLVEDTISADEVGTFKPHREIYRHAAARTGTPIDRIVHASALWLDVQGAVHAGMQGAWVNRADADRDPFGVDPDLVARDFHGIADVLE